MPPGLQFCIRQCVPYKNEWHLTIKEQIKTHTNNQNISFNEINAIEKFFHLSGHDLVLPGQLQLPREHWEVLELEHSRVHEDRDVLRGQAPLLVEEEVSLASRVQSPESTETNDGEKFRHAIHRKASRTQCGGPTFEKSRNRGSRTLVFTATSEGATKAPAHSVTIQESLSCWAGAQ